MHDPVFKSDPAELVPSIPSITRLSPMSLDDVIIETLTTETEPGVKDLIRRNLQHYDEAGSVLASTFRRLADLYNVYRQPGSRFFVLRDAKAPGGPCVGAAGLGSLHGLPPSEGVGELRDLVLEEHYRGRGLGARLIKRCIEEAKALGYKRLYLETTPQMEKAQKLFIRFGFRPVTQASSEAAPLREARAIPCYFILDTLAEGQS
jgi:putative acetyltransferase